MFELLITVSGVGANTARMMLSSMSVSELCSAISRGDERLIKGIKGIGKMTAASGPAPLPLWRNDRRRSSARERRHAAGSAE